MIYTPTIRGLLETYQDWVMCMVQEWNEKWMFSGNEDDFRPYLKALNTYYVYALCRPNGQPFYIGKGKKLRALSHVSEAKQGQRLFEQNPHKNNIIRKIRLGGGAIKYKLAGVFDDEDNSLDFEHCLIEHYKRVCDGGCLSNLDPGRGSARGPAPFSKARHTNTLSGDPNDNPDRAILNNYLQSIGDVESVPVKPLSQISVRHTEPHTQPRKPSARCAYALIASTAAHQLSLAPCVTIPRSFEYKGVQGVLENGVCRDILKAGMATLISAVNPADEAFHLSKEQVDKIISLYHFDKLKALGLIDVVYQET